MPAPPSPTTMSDRKVITPSQTLGGPMSHSHVVYIVAIIIAAVLALAAFGVTYMAWRQGSALEERLANTQAQNTKLATDTASLQDALETTPKPVPFYYARMEQDSGTHLIEVDPVSGVERTVFTLPEDAGSFSVFSIPRVGFDGRVFLMWIPTAFDWLAPNIYPFNIATDSTLEKAPFSDSLPKDLEAIALSPDETLLATVYSEGLNEDAFQDKLVVWNLLSGEATSLLSIDPSKSFARYELDVDGVPIQSGFSLRWTSRDCVFTNTHTVDEASGERTDTVAHTLCIE